VTLSWLEVLKVTSYIVTVELDESRKKRQTISPRRVEVSIFEKS